MLALVALAGTPLSDATAQGNTESLSQQRLRKLGQDISESEAKAKAIEQDESKARAEYSALQRKMVSLAADINQLESDIDATRIRLVDLRLADRQAAIDLEKHAADMAETLAAMQRLSQHPSSTLIAKPEDINTMARTALLFDAILPSLNTQAETLRNKIAAVEEIRFEIRADQKLLQGRQSDLKTQRTGMAVLVADKNRQRKKLSSALKQERRRIANLATEAKDLEDLINRLGAPRSGAVKEKYADVGRPLDSPPFKSARGRLPLPAPGIIVSRFNQRGEDGLRSKGIQMETVPTAQVVSLWDGNIVFAGSFRDYGQLLIISHGGGYHSLLAGMGRIEVDISQWVLAGEPVGQMNTAMQPDTTTTEKKLSDSAKPRLYIELRQDGQSIDPLPWIAVNQRKVKG